MVWQLGVLVNNRLVPSLQDLLAAREAFVSLAAARTPEAVWQSFFAKNRFVLSRALPFQLLPCDILPMGRPGRSEPDFLMHPGSEQSSRIHGVIELKANHSRIFAKPRRNVLRLSSDAATAVRQVETYDALYDTFAPTKRTIALETLSHLIIIMGHAHELQEIEESLLPQIPLIIPAGIRFIGYDELLAAYSRDLPKPAFIMYPDREPSPSNLQRWLGGKKSLVREGQLHRLSAESKARFDPGFGPEDRQFFDLWISSRFSQLPRFPTRFQPVNNPVVYGSEDFRTALRECLHHDIGDRSTLSRPYRHIVFEYSGEMLEIEDESSDDLMGSDYEPSVALATSAVQAGLSGILYTSSQGQGRMAALFRRDAIGKFVSQDVIDLR